ncbi:MAG: DMT family transporter [Thermomicrobiales bacterium]
MTGLALALVLVSAAIHATWNYLTKRINGGVPAVWLFTVVSATVYAPVAIVVALVIRPHIGPVELLFMLGSGVLQLVYFVTLAKGYEKADLSIVYPVARGTGPLLATVLAIVLLGEHPTRTTIAGSMLICGGVFILASGGRLTGGRDRSLLLGVGYGVATGAIIGCYTVWDGHAVGALAIPAVMQSWSAEALRAVYLTPYARRHRVRVRAIWAQSRTQVILVGIMSAGSYMLVLTAMSFSPVSSIAPAREVSILFGTLLGFWLLKEPMTGSRILGALVIVAGVVCVVLG